MTDIGRRRARLGLLLLVLSFPLMLGGLFRERFGSPLYELGQIAYLAGLVLAIVGNTLTLRGTGQGSWRRFLIAAIVLDGLACVSPLMDLAQRVMPALEVTEDNPLTSLSSLPMHMGAFAFLLWAIAEICFSYRIPVRRPQLIRFGIVCLGAAIFFFIYSEGRMGDGPVLVVLMVQLAFVFPVLKIRSQLPNFTTPS